MKFKLLLLIISFLPTIALAQAPAISSSPVSNKPVVAEQPDLAPAIIIGLDNVSQSKTVDVVAKDSNAVSVPVKAEAAPALPPFTPPPEISVQSEVNKTVGAPVAVKPTPAQAEAVVRVKRSKTLLDTPVAVSVER